MKFKQIDTIVLLISSRKLNLHRNEFPLPYPPS